MRNIKIAKLQEKALDSPGRHIGVKIKEQGLKNDVRRSTETLKRMDARQLAV